MSRWITDSASLTLELMSVPQHTVVRSRRRNLFELYVRAYWKTYALALTWVIGVQILIAAVLGR